MQPLPPILREKRYKPLQSQIKFHPAPTVGSRCLSQVYGHEQRLATAIIMREEEKRTFVISVGGGIVKGRCIQIQRGPSLIGTRVTRHSKGERLNGMIGQSQNVRKFYISLLLYSLV